MHIKELTNEEFNTFIENFKDKSIYQTTEYAFTMNKQNFDSILLGMINEEGNIIAASLILVEKTYNFKYAYAPRGFLIDYNNLNLLKTFTFLIKKYLGKLDIIAIKINPIIYKDINSNNNFDEILRRFRRLDYYHLGFNNSFEALKPRFEAIIDLNKSVSDLFNELPKSLKTKIRSAENNGIVIHKGNKSNLNYLYLQTKRKYPRDLSYFEDIFEFFNKKKSAEFYYAKIDTAKYLNKIRQEYQECLNLNDKINNEVLNTKNDKIITKKMNIDKNLNDLKNELIYATKLNQDFKDGIVIASVLIIKHGKIATLLIDGYDTNYKKFNGKHLLIWKLIEKFAKENIKYFNLGGINNPHNPLDKYKGLTDFKLSFNAKAIEYIGDLELITNKPLYFIYRNSSPIRKILKK